MCSVSLAGPQCRALTVGFHAAADDCTGGSADSNAPNARNDRRFGSCEHVVLVIAPSTSITIVAAPAPSPPQSLGHEADDALRALAG